MINNKGFTLITDPYNKYLLSKKLLENEGITKSLDCKYGIFTDI